MFKEGKWINYGRAFNRIKIDVSDESKRPLDRFVCHTEEDYNKVLRIIEKKYGFKIRPEIEKNESINEMKKEENKEIKEKDWLEKDWGW